MVIGAALLLAALLFVATRSSQRASPPPTASAPAASPPPSAAPAPSGPQAEPEAALPGGAFAGRVLSAESGEGIAGAQVTLASESGAELTADTGAGGAFSIEPQAPGRYTVNMVAAPDHLPFAPDWGGSAIALVARPGVRVSDVTLYLKPAVSYTGRVESARGAPVAGAAVSLLDAGPGEQALDQLPQRFTSDAKGEFRFQGAEGSLLEARHPAHGVGRTRLAASARLDRRFVIGLVRDSELAAAAPDYITGRVVDPSGAPVPSPLVRAATPIPDALHPRGEARGDEEGRFRIAGLDPGMHIVWVVCGSCVSTRTGARTGSEVTLVAGAGGAISGRVVRKSDERPMPAFSVRLVRARGMREVVLDERGVIDAEGRFELRGVPAGEYKVRAAARGLAPSPMVPVQVREDGTSPPLVIRLSAGGTIHGSVADRATSAPLAGAWVTVEGMPELAGPLATSPSAMTDRGGSFTLTGVPPGLRSVRATAAGHHMAMASGLRVEDGARLGPLELELSPARDGEPPQLELHGIGARLTTERGDLVIQSLVADGGAQRAGLAVGDAILSVDGQLVAKLGILPAIERTRGPAGTRVVLSVHRVGASAVEDVTVERREFRYTSP